jgi:hypothetical protein
MRGPSLAAVINLGGCGLPEKSAPVPLQRPKRSMMGRVQPTSEMDCMRAHAQAIVQRQADKRTDRRADRREYRADVETWREDFKNEMDDHGHRRGLERQLDSMHLVQQKDAERRALTQHMNDHAPDTYWPYEKRRPGPRIPTLTEHSADLLQQMEAQEHDKAVARAMDRSRATKALGSLQVGKGGTCPVPNKAATDARAATLRQSVLRQAEARSTKLEQLAMSGSSSGVDQRGTLEHDYQHKQQMMRQQQRQMRSVLSEQASEKRRRDLAEHTAIYSAGALAHDRTLHDRTA